MQSVGVSTWQTPPDLVFKLNFNAAIFLDFNYSGVGAIICNGKGEVMVIMFAKGPPIGDSEEAKILACRRVMKFAIDADFTNLVIEGDNAAVMSSISSPRAN